MKVVFLDIDGVLNIGSKMKPGVLKKELVTKLNDLNDVTFVLTSSWGLVFDIEDIELKLKNNGFSGKLKTYLFGEETREEKIINFVKENNITRYVVIDDRNITEDNMVKIDPNLGLTDENINQVKKLLI